MSAHHALLHYFPLTRWRSAAEIEAEIREELEFHLDMLVRDNERAGMPPDEARRDAATRFGDFEANRRACRNITLGPRIMLQRIQTVLLVVLLVAVVYQGFLLLKMQAASDARLEASAANLQVLTDALNQLEARLRSKQADAAVIPTVQWSLAEPTAPDGKAANAAALADWNAGERSLPQPWSDWRSLEDATGVTEPETQMPGDTP